jgi:hypothetical protein
MGNNSTHEARYCFVAKLLKLRVNTKGSLWCGIAWASYRGCSHVKVAGRKFSEDEILPRNRGSSE